MGKLSGGSGSPSSGPGSDTPPLSGGWSGGALGGLGCSAVGPPLGGDVPLWSGAVDSGSLTETPPCSGGGLALGGCWMQPATLIRLCGDGLDEAQGGRFPP